MKLILGNILKNYHFKIKDMKGINGLAHPKGYVKEAVETAKEILKQVNNY